MKKKRIAILTFQSLDNYGQRLQNLAVQHLLNYRGNAVIDSIIIDYRRKPWVNKLMSWMSLRLRSKHRVKRMHNLKFKQFNKKFLRMRSAKANFDGRGYDIVVTGSDQVWNPYLPDDELEIFFLNTIKHSCKLPMAPSLGYDEIPAERKELYRGYLKNLDRISVREKTGKIALSELTEKEVILLVDPTLALDSNVWEEYLCTEEYMSEKKEYALYFMLGREQDEVRRKVVEYAGVHGLDFIDIKLLNEVKDTVVSPMEWMNLIRNANIVITDSFHGIAFSIIFHRQFIAYPRIFSLKEGNDTRILQLLELLGIENRFNMDEISEGYIDYDAVDDILSKEREKWNKYLEEFGS